MVGLWCVYFGFLNGTSGSIHGVFVLGDIMNLRPAGLSFCCYLCLVSGICDAACTVAQATIP